MNTVRTRDTLAKLTIGYLLVALVMLAAVGGQSPRPGSTPGPRPQPAPAPGVAASVPAAAAPLAAAPVAAAAAAPATSSPPAPTSPAGPRVSASAELSRVVATAPDPTQHVYTALSNPLTLYQSEPFLNRISTTGGWGSYSSTGPAPVIAVIDTGFALNHQDLVGRWDGTQGTGNWTGWDFVDGDNNPVAGRTDPSGTAVFHGSMTAGLAGLLNPNAQLMPLQALNDEGVGYTDNIAAAIDYAADNGAGIISMSLGTTTNDPTLDTAINYALGKGVVVVAAAGNSGCNCLSYPAAYPGVLAVGATNPDDTPASFSSYGSNLGVMAPGVAGDVCSSVYTATNATSAYTCGYSGTSFATPLVAGLAALVLQENPSLTPTQVISLIETNADEVAAMDGQSHTLMEGYGRIDVAKTLAATVAETTTIYGATASSVCVGFPGAVCDLKLDGPGSQVVDLGTVTLNQAGVGRYSWSASGLGLAQGSWQLHATLSAAGDTISLPPSNASLSW